MPAFRSSPTPVDLVPVCTLPHPTSFVSSVQPSSCPTQQELHRTPVAHTVLISNTRRNHFAEMLPAQLHFGNKRRRSSLDWCVHVRLGCFLPRSGGKRLADCGRGICARLISNCDTRFHIWTQALQVASKTATPRYTSRAS